MTIMEWLRDATGVLADDLFPTARLDAEIILAHTIGHPRTWLHAHPDESIDDRHREIADARLDLRLDHVPVAYIIGHKEFYGRRFHVSPAVLIPRPESEQMIALLNEAVPTTTALELDTPAKRLVDIGSGSGCLGITAKLEHPELQVTLLDNSRPALNVAEKNVRSFGADIQTIESNLLDDYPYEPDIVLANLPYVGEDWERSEETKHEPAEALFAKRDGLELIERCFEQLSHRMKPGGVAIFEADPRQWKRITTIANQAGFGSKRQERFAALYVKN